MTRDKQLGKYRITGLLGQGGMGVVYQALDPDLHRTVAIKVLSKQLAGDAEMLERFLREARSAAKIHHPHVVTVFDVGRAGEDYFVVMEWVPGGNAELSLRRGQPLPWLEATRIIAGACRGLIAAHHAGLIHRDIKPANILLGEKGAVKLADFGLVRRQGAGATALTSKDHVMGTPAYMSPEQARGEGLTDLSDLYSLGATYFALLTGQPPYIREDPLQVLFAHCSSPVPDPRKLHADVPQKCAAIIAKAMAKDPLERYGSAEEMLGVLDLLLPAVGMTSTSPTMVAPILPPAVVPPPAPVIGDIAAPPIATPPPVKSALPAPSQTSNGSDGSIWQPHILVAGIILILVLGLVATWGLGGFAGPAVVGKNEANRSAEWKPLFDSKTLDGWSMGRSPGKWKVEGGNIVGVGENSYLHSRRADYRNFHIRIEARINQGGNGGLFFRCDNADGLPNGYEAQIGIDDLGELHRLFHGVPNGSMTSQPIQVSPGEWFTLEVIAKGNEIQVVANQVTTITFHEESPEHPRGHFALQAYTPQTKLEVRKIEILELAP